MYPKRIKLKLLLFIFFFTITFFGIRAIGLITASAPTALPILFSAITLIFSVISGFVIQSKWQTWNELIDATHGETSSLKQLHMLASHFPIKIQQMIRTKIQAYLTLIIEESNAVQRTFARSEDVEKVIYQLEETVLDIDYKEHPNIGSLTFDLVRKCLEYREKRLQNLSHKLPRGVKLFTINATIAVIFSSLFVGEDTRIYDYFLTLIVALLSYGIYLLIDDLDNPYRPGQWHLTNTSYVELSKEVEKYLEHPEKNHTLLRTNPTND